MRRIRTHSRTILILAVFTSMLILFCSCGNETKKVSYSENEIKIPENIKVVWDFSVFSDGMMRLAATKGKENKGYIWESENGGDAWRELYCYTDALQLDDCTNYDCPIRLGDKGDAVCMVVDNSRDDIEANCYYISEKEKVKEIKNTLPDSQVSNELAAGNGFSWSAAMVDDNNILVSNKSGETYLVNKDTNKVSAEILDSDNPLLSSEMYIVDGSYIYLIGVGDVIKYDIKAKKVTSKDDESLKLLKEMAAESDKTTIMAVHNDDYYAFNEDGLSRISGGEKAVEVGKANMSFSPSEVYGRKILFDTQDNIYLAINQENESARVLCYKKTSDVSDKQKDKLKVFSLRKDEGIQKIVDNYQIRNKNVEIELVIGTEVEDNTNIDEVVKKLNTSMLGGDGPDVIFLDGLNIDTYQKNNMLLRLDSDIPEISRKGNYHQIIESYTKGDAVYAATARFSLPIILSKHSDVLRAKNGTELINNVKKNSVGISEYELPNFVRFYYQVYCRSNLDQGEMNDQEIREYLRNMKALFELQSNSENVNLSHLILPPQQIGGGIDYLMGNTGFEVDYLSDGKQLQLFDLVKMSDYDFISNDKRIYYMPRCVVGINAATNQEEESKKFVSYIFSEDGQAVSCDTMGLPANENDLNAVLSSLRNDQLEIGNDTNSKTVNLNSLSDADIEYFTSKIKAVNEMTNNNSIVMNIIMKYTEKYLNGELGEDQVIEEVHSRLELYTNE